MFQALNQSEPAKVKAIAGKKFRGRPSVYFLFLSRFSFRSSRPQLVKTRYNSYIHEIVWARSNASNLSLLITCRSRRPCCSAGDSRQLLKLNDRSWIAPRKEKRNSKYNQFSSVNIPAITEDSFEVKGEAIDASPSRTTWGWSISSICFNISWIFFYKNNFVVRKNKAVLLKPASATWPTWTQTHKYLQIFWLALETDSNAFAKDSLDNCFKISRHGHGHGQAQPRHLSSDI